MPDLRMDMAPQPTYARGDMPIMHNTYDHHPTARHMRGTSAASNKVPIQHGPVVAKGHTQLRGGHTDVAPA